MNDDLDRMQTMKRDGQPASMDDLDAQMTMRPQTPPSFPGDAFDAEITIPRYRRAEGMKDGELKRDDVLDGRYKIEDELGRGGMGIVYKAFDKNTDKWCAIKVVLPENIENPEALRELRTELVTARELSDDNILRYYDFAGDGSRKYIVIG